MVKKCGCRWSRTGLAMCSPMPNSFNCLTSLQCEQLRPISCHGSQAKRVCLPKTGNFYESTHNQRRGDNVANWTRHRPENLLHGMRCAYRQRCQNRYKVSVVERGRSGNVAQQATLQKHQRDDDCQLWQSELS